MAWHDPFLLGPLGAMRELPSPPAGGGVDVDPVRIGGVREALGGRTVVDVWRVVREWSFSWPDGFPAEVERVLRAWHGLDRRPRRLLDPMHGPNLATLDLSAGGAVTRSVREITVGGSSGSASFAPRADMPAALDDVTGAYVWQVPESSSNLVLRAGSRRPAPTLGGPVCVSAYVRGAGGCRVQGIGRTAAGAEQTHPGPEIALSGAWQRMSAVVPAGAVESVSVGLWARSGASRTVEATGWQIEHGTEPSEWSLGGACPRVVLLDHTHSYRRLNRRDMSLVLREVP